jgi:amino acid adenylation domain-containing protein
MELYNSFEEGRATQLTPLEIQFADYAIWQKQELQGDPFQHKLDYWKEKLKAIEPLQLPADFTKSVNRSISGAATVFQIDKELTKQIGDLGNQRASTLFMVLLAAFKILLHRYSHQQDICVGTSIANRTRKEVEGLIGFFVNTLPLRTMLNSDLSFIDLLELVKSTTLEAYQHQDIPYEKIVEAVITERDTSSSPLFQVMLVMPNTPDVQEMHLGNVETTLEPFSHNTSKFDISFFVTETSNGLTGTVEYSTDLYEAATIQRMTAHFKTLLQSVVNNPNQKIGLLPMLEEGEAEQLLNTFNDSEIIYPKDKSIIDLFEEQSMATPENTAIVFENETLSYRQLNERSNQLAHYLQSKGVTRDSLVPLYIERSAAMMVAMLGIMKAGAAYVPVDTDFPSERISYMLKDTDATIIVGSRQSKDQLPDTGLAIVVAIDGDELKGQPVTNPSIKPSPGQLAYVIYTSGSTGRPKGVMIEHRSLVDYYYGLNKHTQIDQCKSFALVSTIATDLGNTVIYASLLSGGALHVFTKESVSNIEYLHRYFSTQKIDCLKIVPSHWKALSNDGDFLLPNKLLVLGGEALPTELVENIHANGSSCRVVNHYGPTETTIGKLLHVTEPGKQYNKTIPIGQPFSNTKVYVLSKELQLCPTGIPGQLFIAGDGVARGYFNNEALTE